MGKHNADTAKTAPVFWGTGLIALDVILNGDPDAKPHLLAGGSCGNVLTILAYMGWKSCALARLGKDKASEIITKDMGKHDVNLDHVQYATKVSTPIIHERINKGSDGQPTHRFYWTCPNCGSWLPRFRPALLRDMEDKADSLPAAQCFFFDRVSPGALHLAEKARGHGALVVFEPPNIKGDRPFRKALQVCDVLKYSNERGKQSNKDTYESPAWLVIETLGAEGLRYRIRRNSRIGSWKLLSAFTVKDLTDAAGAGDWCTAGFLDVLLRQERKATRRPSEKRVVKALRHGQALSAVNCRFEGARGAMYALSKDRFGKEVAGILSGNEATTPVADLPGSKTRRAVKCICPACNARRRGAKNGK